MKYSCTISLDKKVMTRLIDADSEYSAQKMLKAEGFKIIRIRRKYNIDIGKTYMKKKDLVDLSDEIIFNLPAGISILNIVKELASRSRKDKAIYGSVYLDLTRGVSFYESLRRTNMFPIEFLQIVQVGETSGNLVGSLEGIRDYYISVMLIENKLKMQSIYPTILMSSCVGILILFVKFIAPQLQDLLEGQQLPALTQAYIDLMNYINSKLTVICAFLALFVSTYIYALKTPKLRYYIDKFKVLYSPMKSVTNVGILSRFIKYVYLLYMASVPLPSAMEQIKKILGNSYIASQLETATTSLNQGKSLAEALENVSVLDRMTLMKLEQSEKAGTLEIILLNLSKNLDSRIVKSLAKFNALVEPIIIIFLAIIAGSFIVAIMLPIMGMSSSINVSQ